MHINEDGWKCDTVKCTWIIIFTINVHQQCACNTNPNHLKVATQSDTTKCILMRMVQQIKWRRKKWKAVTWQWLLSHGLYFLRQPNLKTDIEQPSKGSFICHMAIGSTWIFLQGFQRLGEMNVWHSVARSLTPLMASLCFPIWRLIIIQGFSL